MIDERILLPSPQDDFLFCLFFPPIFNSFNFAIAQTFTLLFWGLFETLHAVKMLIWLPVKAAKDIKNVLCNEDMTSASSAAVQTLSFSSSRLTKC